MADRRGPVTGHAVQTLQDRCTLFVAPGATVYEALHGSEHARHLHEFYQAMLAPLFGAAQGDAAMWAGTSASIKSTMQTLLQQSIDVKGERATVVTRLADSEYEQTVIYELVRAGDRWVVRGVRTL